MAYANVDVSQHHAQAKQQYVALRSGSSDHNQDSDNSSSMMNL